MARVPEFTREVVLDRAQASNIDAAFANNGGNRAAQLYSDAATYKQSAEKVGAFGRQITAQMEVTGQLKAQERFNEYQRTKTTYYSEQKNQRMTNPDGFAKDFDDWIRFNSGEIEDSLQDPENDEPFDLDYFRQLVDRDRTSTFEQSTNWEDGMRVQNITVGTEKNLDGMNVNFSLQNPRLKDLPKQLNSVKDYVNDVGANVFSPAENQRLFGYGANQAAASVFDNMLETDPKTLRNVMLYGQGTKDQLIDFVFEVEGRDAIAQEPDGAIAKYGINSKHNNLTHEQVKALTPETAREILANKYWDPRLDKMDPAMRAVAFDAIVNHGNDKQTWKMITEAKGDPYALIQARQEYYLSLISVDPEKYGQYKNGWEARMQEMSGYVQSLDAGGRDFLNHAGLVDPDIINRTKGQIFTAIDAKKRQDEVIQKQKLAQFNVAAKDLNATMTKELEPISQEEMNTVTQLAVNSGDPEAIAQAQAMQNNRVFVSTLKGQGQDQLKAVRNMIAAQVTAAATPDNRMQLSLVDSVIEQQKKAIDSDGMLVAMARTGMVSMPQPLTYQSPAETQGNLAGRAESALNVFNKTGDLPNLLAPYEIDQLVEAQTNMDVEDFSQLIGSFDDLHPRFKQDIAASVSAKSPVLLTAMNADTAFTRKQILRGAKMEDPKYEQKDMDAMVASMMDDLRIDPGARETIAAGVSAYYKASEFDSRSTEITVNENKVRKAMEAVIAPIVDIGGQEIFTFKDPETNQFLTEQQAYDVFNSVTPETLQKVVGRSVTDAKFNDIDLSDIQDMTFVAAGTDIVTEKDGSTREAPLYYVLFSDGEYVPDPEDRARRLTIDGQKLFQEWKKSGQSKAYRGRYLSTMN